MHYAKFIFADGIRGAYIGAHRIIAMHAHLHSGLYSHCPFYIIHMYHRLLAVGLTFGAGRFTGFATYTSLHIHKKFHLSFVISRSHAIVFNCGSIKATSITLQANTQYSIISSL
jgi:hypothetical protein